MHNCSFQMLVKLLVEILPNAQKRIREKDAEMLTHNKNGERMMQKQESTKYPHTSCTTILKHKLSAIQNL